MHLVTTESELFSNSRISYKISIVVWFLVLSPYLLYRCTIAFNVMFNYSHLTISFHGCVRNHLWYFSGKVLFFISYQSLPINLIAVCFRKYLVSGGVPDRNILRTIPAYRSMSCHVFCEQLTSSLSAYFHYSLLNIYIFLEI